MSDGTPPDGTPAIVLLASFADMQSAIRIHGSPNGARLVIDVPEVSIVDLTTLLGMRGRAFYLAFLPVDDAPSQPIPEEMPARSQWATPPALE